MGHRKERRAAGARYAPLLLLPLACAAAGAGAPSAEGPAPAVVGSRSCKRCHEDFYEKWVSSWHGLAMQPYSKAWAARTLVPMEAPIAVRGTRYRFDLNAGAVLEEVSVGVKTYPLAHVMGGKNTAYFLTPFVRGRLQVLPLAFDTRRREWYDTTGSMVRHFPHAVDAPVDWTDPFLTFNTSCYGCHVSQISKRYDLATDAYRTEWVEPGINCETCHGPGERHVAAMEALAPGAAPGDLEIIAARRLTPAQTNSLCGACHAKAGPFTAGLMPGDEFFDHYVLTCLEHPDFHPDGRDLGENFTHTTWLLSPCLKAPDLTCMHCHTSSGRNKHAGAAADNACLPCHERQVGNPAAHSHHTAESEGSRCVACHMPETEFARMRRHDHSMRPPAPAATAAFGSPNACGICHPDKDAAWADRLVREWYPRDYQAPMLWTGALVAAARARRWERLEEMGDYVAGRGRNEVVAASLVRLLAACEDARKWPVVYAAARDPSPLVRGSAARALAAAPAPDPRRALEVLGELARDPRRGVRFEAASVLARVPVEALPAAARAAAAACIAEYETLLRARTDDFAGHYNLGNLAQDRGDFDKALASYAAARRLNPSFIPARVNMALCHARRGDNDAAERELRDALRIEPQSAEALFNLGLLRAERGDPGEAEQCLRAALKADPHLAQAAYNLAVMVIGERPDEGLRLFMQAVEEAPSEPRYSYAFAFHLRRLGEPRRAIEILRSLGARSPPGGEVIALLGLLYEETGALDEARALYREARGRADLPEGVRLECAARLAALEGR
ncbi:MAG TPA: tetratricopeptide repeat protein [Planctomycetota bacterium]|nr:tetratricopeptide repeat protein [Planctomycetota bacterium]OQC21457.1 MAG: tetratricopeptide repeat protein [Planctomycetes bacterium ADurb.Bin069]HNR97784.1 tetratricopeptide repeat protein [Planctomycetota bacterium]HNU24749.1 tetratricopeptide repeat protein [Planctomycetota bacterium]HOE29951.1 tetratricopeptide repeat protein [Planctomycetota bacterium]